VARGQHSSWARRHLWSLRGEILLTVGLATVGFFVGFGGLRARLSQAVNSGDMLMAYVATALSSDGGFYGGSRFGYPLAMDLRYFPSADHLPSSVAAGIAAVTGNPFLGVNAVWALSFPATALAGLWLMRLVGLRGPLAVLGALAVTFTPYHWERTYHVWLATSYSAVLAVCLALYVGSGQWRGALAGAHRRRSIVLMVALCVVIATSGIYYAVFAVMLTGVAVLWRWVRGAHWRDLVLDALPAVGVVAGLALSLLPAWWFLHTNPPFTPIAQRYPWESVQYSGVLSYVLLPSPASGIPGFAHFARAVIAGGDLGPTSGVRSTSDFGTLFTTLALLVGVIGTMWLARRARRSGTTEPAEPGEVGPGLVAVLIAVAALFFVPWGLNYLFAVAVSPQIRAWDRLVPVLLSLFVALGAVTLRRLGATRVTGRALVAVFAVGLLVLGLDAVWPYRAGVTSAAAAAQAEQAEGAHYATELNAAIPGRCAVLQLPYVAYPEVAPVETLGAYDHAWPALTNPEKSWSFGANKGTFDSGWLEQLGDSVDASEVADLAAGGFCAIHVDLRGYTADRGPEVIAALTTILGAPVASGHGGMWQAFAVPGWSAPLTEQNLSAEPIEVQDFFAPLHVTATDAGVVADEGQWVMTAPEAHLTVRTGDDDATFGAVTVPVTAALCTARDVAVTVTTDHGTAHGTAHVAAGGDGRVVVDLPAPVSDADLLVEATGPACSVGGTDVLLTVGAPTRTP